MYIPDVREKIDEGITGNLKRPNAYYEGLQSDIDKEYVKGYDVCVNEVIQSFNDYDYDYEADFLRCGFDPNKVDEEVIAADKNFDDYESSELAEMSNETRLLLLIGQYVLRRLENARNEIVVSNIDFMDESEYDEKFKALCTELGVEAE